jgi:hypothetical protein
LLRDKNKNFCVKQISSTPCPAALLKKFYSSLLPFSVLRGQRDWRSGKVMSTFA